MASYLTLAEFKLATLVSGADVDRVEAKHPGFTERRLAIESAHIDARLSKRYAAPFASPYPDVVVGWLVAIVSEQVLRRRGIDPNDEQAATYIKDADTARAELLEAANAEKGLFDLPLRQDTTKSGISKGGPLGYSEHSPYVWLDRQRRTARDEDAAGEGTSDA